MVVIYTLIVLLTYSVYTIEGNPLLQGCVLQSSLAITECERDIRFRFGYANNTATDCCVYWGLYDCFQDELARRCPSERVNDLTRYLHADHTIKVTADCKRFPSRFWCELHFIGFWFSMIFIILAIIVFIVIVVFIVLFLKRRFLRRKDHRRPLTTTINNAANNTKQLRTEAPLANSKIDDL